MFKNFLLAFGLCGLAIASAKTYTVTLAEPFSLAGKQLKPGDYRLTLNGSQVVLKDPNGRAIPAKATVADGTHKYPYTAIEAHQGKGAPRIQAIELEGTTKTVKFN